MRLNDADKLYVGGAAVDKVYLGSALVWQALTPIVISGPALVDGYGSGKAGSGTVYTTHHTFSASGGTGSYTYNWTRVNGDTSVAATNPTSAVTAFYGTASDFAGGDGMPGFSTLATMRLTVSDGVQVATHDVAVTLAWESTGTGGLS